MNQTTDRPDKFELEDLGQLELPISESRPTSKGITVQTLGSDPYSVTKYLQVHNTLETLLPGAPIIDMYGGKTKPPGFGNPGGGMEPDEYDRFKTNEPERFKYYDSLGTLSEDDLKIIGCAFRESQDESGFCDIEIALDEDTKKLIILNDYYYKGGHRVITVWGKYRSYRQRPIKEAEEIDYVDWTDFSMPMSEVYRRLRQKVGDPPAYPYWSHLRRICSALPMIDRYNRDREERSYSIGNLIHSSWRTVYRVGRGDNRFPNGGYMISPEDWYHMFDIMLEKGIEDLDNETLLTEFNGRAKLKVLVFDPSDRKYKMKAREKDLNLGGKIALAKNQEFKEVPAVETLEGSEDYTGIPTSAEAIAREDKEYFEALDRKFGQDWYKG